MQHRFHVCLTQKACKYFNLVENLCFYDEGLLLLKRILCKMNFQSKCIELKNKLLRASQERPSLGF